jgi:hypothetical protein
MHSLGSGKLSALRARDILVRGLATAGAIGAMLTCIAVVLNVGPFAAPRVDGLPGHAVREARAFTELPVGSASSSRPEFATSTQADRSQLVMKTADAAELNRPGMELASVPAAGPATLAPQPATLTAGDGEGLVKPPQQDTSVADAATPPHGDQASPDLAKKATIVGVWAPDAGTCSARNFRERVLPAVINTDGAWAGETFCLFKNKTPTETGWKVVAECSNPRERWTVNVRLTVDGNRLTWTSKRGTQAYTRCTDLLMAEAR